MSYWVGTSPSGYATVNNEKGIVAYIGGDAPNPTSSEVQMATLICALLNAHAAGTTPAGEDARSGLHPAGRDEQHGRDGSPSARGEGAE